MNTDSTYLQRCLQLAGNGAGNVAPNPLVGCVLVADGRIIGEGFHRQHGGPHAEVEAIRAVADPALLREATLYVNLEPCSHHGKTPPCADLIIEKGIPRVVIGTTDPHDKVAGKGIARLEAAGCAVTAGVLEQESLELNRRFFTFHQQQRPYIVLKWAQSADGYIDRHREPGDGKSPQKISGPEAQRLVHRWRSEEMAIMVGTQTALLDDPQLTVRAWTGKDPIRIFLDRTGRLPNTLKAFRTPPETWVFTEQPKRDYGAATALPWPNSLASLLAQLHERQVLSVLVEGGQQLLQSLIDAGLWDEARVFAAPASLGSGVAAPRIGREADRVTTIGNDHLFTYRNA